MIQKCKLLEDPCYADVSAVVLYVCAGISGMSSHTSSWPVFVCLALSPLTHRNTSHITKLLMNLSMSSPCGGRRHTGIPGDSDRGLTDWPYREFWHKCFDTILSDTILTCQSPGMPMVLRCRASQWKVHYVYNSDIHTISGHLKLFMKVPTLIVFHRYVGEGGFLHW